MMAYQVVGLLCLVFLPHAQLKHATEIFPLDVENTRFPFFAQIMYRNYRWCGGTIINTRYILTAARCLVEKTPHDMYVVVGATSDYVRVYGIEKLIEYNDTDPEVSDDIGLMRTAKEITYHDGHVEPVTLTSKDYEVTGYPAVTFEFSAWEVTSLLDFGWCRYYITELEDRRWTCKKGNSHFLEGSPLLVDGCQVGIASYKYNALYAAAFTRVYLYLDWIQTHTADYGQSNSPPNYTPAALICACLYLSWLTGWITR